MPQEVKRHLALTHEEWEILQPILHRVALKPGDILFEEGAQKKDLYFLNNGSLAVSKKGHVIAILQAGDWVGEITALTQINERTASVIARESSILWELPFDALHFLMHSHHKIYFKLIGALSNVMANRIRSTNEVAVDHKLEIAQTKVVWAKFLCAILFGLATFLYAVKIISVMHFTPRVTAAISIPLILLLSGFCLIFMKRSGFPFSSFGLTWKNGQKSVVESLFCTLPLILGTLLIKWILIVTIYRDQPLMNFSHLLHSHLTPADWLLITVGYSLFVPLQALMVNGCMQTVFTKFFPPANRNFLAIVLSNLLFSMMHLQLSIRFAFLAFFVGCVWGWLYSRHHTIVGISLSHIILGLWVGIFMGYR